MTNGMADDFGPVAVVPESLDKSGKRQTKQKGDVQDTLQVKIREIEDGNDDMKDEANMDLKFSDFMKRAKNAHKQLMYEAPSIHWQAQTCDEWPFS